MLIRNLYERRLSDSCSGSRVHCEHLCLSNLCDEPIMKPTNEEPQILCILSVTYLKPGKVLFTWYIKAAAICQPGGS